MVYHMSQKEVIQYIIDWYNAYFEKKNMKNFSLKQIDLFYKLANNKKLMKISYGKNCL